MVSLNFNFAHNSPPNHKPITNVTQRNSPEINCSHRCNLAIYNCVLDLESKIASVLLNKAVRLVRRKEKGNYVSNSSSRSFWTGWSCPKDWLYFNGSCYRAHDTKLSWFHARAACRENEGHLLSKNSDGEQQFVYQRMAVNKTFWIGLVKDKNSLSFLWSKGEELAYLNWIPREGNILGNEDCGEMTNYGSFHGQWNDKCCSKKQPYICEKG